MKLSENQKKFLRLFGLKAAVFLINVLLKTVRIKVHNYEQAKKIIDDNKNLVAAFWHGSMLLGWYLHRDKNFGALVSMSKDGGVLAHILSKWNYKVIRGSSHTGGNEALQKLVELTEKNYSIAITPDGPTGPIHKLKAGAVVAAKKANIPLLLVGIGIKNKYVLKSWDQFEIPKPFTVVHVKYSDPIYIDQNLNYDETSIKISECEELLNKLHKEALELCSA